MKTDKPKARLPKAKAKPDSADYLKRKAFYDQLITLYGRNPVIEVLKDPQLEVYRVHLADSNRDSGVIKDIKQLAANRGVEIVYHSRLKLSRISRNGKQDQGVACDIHCTGFLPLTKICSQTLTVMPAQILALLPLMALLIRKIWA